MGSYLKRFWQPDGGGMNKTERMGGSYYPYCPDELCGSDISLGPTCVSSVVNAQAGLIRLESKGTLTDLEPLARLLLRAEAVSSSRIEGLEMPASKLLEYEELDRLGVDHRLDGVEAQVLGNLHALVDGIGAISSRQEVTVERICDIHRGLMQGTRLESIGGHLRTEQNWIGGNRVNPVGAAYVPPEAKDVPRLMTDLSDFIRTSSLPPVAIAALAHAQLETIHPFADGNGRVGRALVHVVLRSSGASRVTVPPVSLLLATDRDRYIANLSAFRTAEGEDWRAAANEWVEYFANILTESCARASEFERAVEGLKADWLQKTSFRAGSAGRLLLDVLPGTPVLSIQTAQKMTGRSYPAARSAILALQEAGILRQNAKNRKSGIYVADDVMVVFNSYERSLATLSGDTSFEKPKRSVPQRRPFVGSALEDAPLSGIDISCPEDDMAGDIEPIFP